MTLCIYHGNCADGFTAAWAVWKALGESAEYHAGQYGVEPPDVTGRDVLLVDFSYKADVLLDMERKARTLLVLDHHKTARDDLAHLPPPPVGYYHAMIEHARQINMPASYAVFDMERSGAGITWDFFHPGIARPLLVDYVEDRDLWRFKQPLSREVAAYIFSFEYTFKNWEMLNAFTRDHMGIQHVADMGGSIERKHFKDIKELLASVKRRMVIGGHDVPVANLPYTMSSDAGNMLAQGEPFAACYVDTAHGRSFSLRSTDAGVDVSEVAKRYGGGGHRNASGFRMPIGWEGDVTPRP